MNWLSKIFSTGAKELASELGESVVKMSEAHLGKKELKKAIEQMAYNHLQVVEDGITETLRSKERVMLAELGQEDKLTKRARPMIAISGIWMAAVEAIFRLVLMLTGDVDPLKVATIPPLVPLAYWAGWSGITATWAISRGVEKVKANGWVGKAAAAVTGNKKRDSSYLLDEER